MGECRRRRGGLHRTVGSRRPPHVRAGKPATAVVSILLGLVLLTSGLGTWSRWQDQVEQSFEPLTAGWVSLTGTLEVRLLSRQQAGKRTYASTRACTAQNPYTECRIVTSTLATERLIPGDTVRVARSITLDGEGDNLEGDLTIDAAALVDQSPGAATFARTAAVSLAVTKPDASAAAVNGLSSTIPVTRASGFGTYTAVVTIATPATDSGARWDSRLQEQVLDLGALTAEFTQTR